MAKKQDPCPRCGENKVRMLGDNEHMRLKKSLHNAHVIYAPYSDYRVWVCEGCGWFTIASWHDEAHNERLYRMVAGIITDNDQNTEPEPEPEPVDIEIIIDED